MQGMNVIFRCTFHTSRHTSPGDVPIRRPNKPSDPPADNRTTVHSLVYNGQRIISCLGTHRKPHTDNPTAVGLGLAMPLGS